MQLNCKQSFNLSQYNHLSEIRQVKSEIKNTTFSAKTIIY